MSEILVIEDQVLEVVVDGDQVLAVEGGEDSVLVVLSEPDQNVSVTIDGIEQIAVIESIGIAIEQISVIESGPQGIPGPSGLPAIGSMVDEVLIGSVNGANLVFATTYDYLPGSTQVFVNGLKQRTGIDYWEKGVNEIMFSEAPMNTGYTDHLTIVYSSSHSS
jgi:hypothetical protein